MKKLRDKLDSVWKRQYWLPAGVVVLFAVIGVIILFISRAATPFASVEPESGTVTTATKSPDTKASNGSYVQFGTAGGGCTTNCGGGSGGDGTTGSLFFEENFNNPTSPIVNTTGGTVGKPQAGNWGFQSTYFNGNGKFFANFLPGPGQAALPALDGVTNYVDFQMPVPTATCPKQPAPPITSYGSCAFEAADNGGPHYGSTLGNQVGQTTYNSMAFYVPAGGLSININGGMEEIQELHFANLLNGAPVRFGLLADHVTIFLDTGQCVQGSYCAYHSNADSPNTHPAGSTLLPGVYAIPPGKIVAGTWNEIIVRVNWATGNTGSVTAWYRVKGGNWTQGGQINNIPTTQFLAGGQPPNTWNDGPEAYGFAWKTAGDIYEAGYADGSGFASVANILP